jgi:hypothetical protein
MVFETPAGVMDLPAHCRSPSRSHQTCLLQRILQFAKMGMRGRAHERQCRDADTMVLLITVGEGEHTLTSMAIKNPKEEKGCLAHAYSGPSSMC